MWSIVKAVMKSAIKYALKSILRKSGVFGIYGTIKTFGGWKDVIQKISKNKRAFEVFKRLVKKNVLRNLHSANFVYNIKKFGLGESAKRVIKNRLVPMEYRKFCWYLNEVRREMKIQEAQSILMNKGRRMSSSVIHGNQLIIQGNDVEHQVKLIDGMRVLKPQSEKEKELREAFLDKRIAFGVNSPEKHNFSQRLHFYEQFTKDYYVPIRSGNHKYVRYYMYPGVQWKVVRQAILKANYGREIFSKIRGK